MNVKKIVFFFFVVVRIILVSVLSRGEGGIVTLDINCDCGL